MVKDKKVVFNCESCGLRKLIWGTLKAPTCVSCGRPTCDACMFSGLCTHCSNLLTPEERDSITPQRYALPKGGECLIGILCILVPVGALVLFLGFNPTISHPEMVNLIPVGAAILITVGVLFIVIFARESAIKKQIAKRTADYLPTIRQRMQDQASTTKNVVDNLMQMVNQPSPQGQGSQKFCITCGKALVESDKFDPETGQRPMICPGCSKLY